MTKTLYCQILDKDGKVLLKYKSNTPAQRANEKLSAFADNFNDKCRSAMKASREKKNWWKTWWEETGQE